MTSNATDTERVEATVGSAIERREDPALITGEAQYTGDFIELGMAHAAILRSQYGYARVEGIDIGAAEAHNDVIAVLTADDINDETPANIPVGISPPSGPLLISREESQCWIDRYWEATSFGTPVNRSPSSSPKTDIALTTHLTS